jgi:2-polyprenyl-6-methoxyphenol hydroxylase-like FAD-dependent oxidoreductase
VNGHPVTYIDFERLRQPHPYIAMVPQWDLLNLLAEAAKAEPNFTLQMKTEVTGLLREGGKVTGVRYQGLEGPGELRAELTVACDGRWSIARREAGLKTRNPGELACGCSGCGGRAIRNFPCCVASPRVSVWA